MTTVTEALRECPFCGSDDIACVPAEEDPDYESDYPVVAACMNCSADGPAGDFKSAAEAIAAWNARSALSSPGEEKEDRRLADMEARDNLALIDWIAKTIGLPHDEELSQVNFAAWLGTKPVTPAPGDVVERLNGLADAEDYLAGLGDDERDRHLARRDTIHGAIALLEQQTALIAEMREALKPLVALADAFDKQREAMNVNRRDEGLPEIKTPLSDGHRVTISLGDCRRARIAATKEG